MKIAHFGPLTPPLGGISVFLYRLSKTDKDLIFFNSNKIVGTPYFKYWFVKQIFDKEKKRYIIHLHSIFVKLVFYILSTLSKHEYSIYIHGRTFINEYYQSNSFIKILVIKMLNRAKTIFIVNKNYLSFLNHLELTNGRIIVKNAFLPPPLEDENRILEHYNSELLEFIKEKDPLVIANAYALSFYKGKELYGLDMCIELISRLKDGFPKIGLIFALADNQKNRWYLEKMKRKIVSLNLEKSIYIMTGQKELWPLFKKADLMVRPTFIDSYGVSIAEALYFDCPAVASDVCERPEGTVIFENRNLTDFYEKCKNVLHKNS